MTRSHCLLSVRSSKIKPREYRSPPTPNFRSISTPLSHDATVPWGGDQVNIIPGTTIGRPQHMYTCLIGKNDAGVRAAWRNLFISSSRAIGCRRLLDDGAPDAFEVAPTVADSPCDISNPQDEETYGETHMHVDETQ